MGTIYVGNDLVHYVRQGDVGKRGKRKKNHMRVTLGENGIFALQYILYVPVSVADWQRVKSKFCVEYKTY
jgi:hypothetical protein